MKTFVAFLEKIEKAEIGNYIIMGAASGCAGSIIGVFILWAVYFLEYCFYKILGRAHEINWLINLGGLKILIFSTIIGLLALQYKGEFVKKTMSIGQKLSLFTGVIIFILAFSFLEHWI